MVDLTIRSVYTTVMIENRRLKQIPTTRLERFCQQWQIREFALFGSVLRDDFRPDSDVDVLVTFAENAQWSLLDLVRMQDELVAIFQRPVDLLTKRGLERSANRARKERILRSARPLIVMPAPPTEVSHVPG